MSPIAEACRSAWTGSTLLAESDGVADVLRETTGAVLHSFTEIGGWCLSLGSGSG